MKVKIIIDDNEEITGEGFSLLFAIQDALRSSEYIDPQDSLDVISADQEWLLSKAGI